MAMKFPIFTQLDGMDCGPTCLRMIAAHHGRKFTLESLRELCEIGKTGVSLLGISEAADRIGMRSLAVEIPFATLRDEVPLPCIAHWDQNHFVVVYQITRDRVWVADPAHGKISYTHAEFIAGWTARHADHTEATKGILLLLETTPAFFETPEAAPGADNEQRGLVFFYNYLRPHKKLLLQLVLGLSVALVLDLIFPFLTQTVVDLGIGNLDLNLIHLLLIGQLVLSFSQLAIDIIQGWILLHVGARVSTALISDFLRKLLRLPMAFFDSRTTGDIMQRVEDNRRVNRFLTSSSLDVLFSGFTFLVFASVLAVYNIGILLLFVGMTVLSVGWLLLFLKKRRIIDQKRFHLESKEQDKFIELVSGVQEIKIQGLERPKRWEWEELNVRHFKLNSQSLALKHMQRVGTSFLSQLRNILITYLAARAVVGGEMTLGMMLSTQYIVGQLVSPIQRLIDFVQQAQDARLSLERMQEIYTQKEEDHYSRSLLTTFPANRSLLLHNLSFRYPGAGQKDVLSNINLQIPEGRVTAVVGASGSGKTTLMKLLLGLHQPTAGTIYVGGSPLANYDAVAWRRRCGVVMQDGFIFPDTLARNIACSDGPINPLHLQGAIYMANLQELVQSLPLGIETRIGGDGQGLSGGQKQRILIARALYKSPEYMLLDEATSALDAKNEHTILDNLNHYSQGRTVVVIAHRLSTVRNADQIVVIDGGRIVEQGNHWDLVRQRGIYYHLVRNQLDLEETARHAS
jgi:ATP-binding cassette subfamily B protein